mmetsp:Transcript_50493/g.56333  ORF Transcript_50493/g.56333 Transcript_50493/m.56333 type:complete len:836 (-) Transcript_50493:77-2584(-)
MMRFLNIFFLNLLILLYDSSDAFAFQNTAGSSLSKMQQYSGLTATNGEKEMKKSRLVWLTGYEDLRLHDQKGFKEAFTKAAERDEFVVPIFVIDPKIYLRSRSSSSLRRLHKCLSSVEKEISSLSSSSSSLHNLVVRTGSSSWVIPALAQEINAVACHVIADDVVSNMRNAQRSTCDSLAEMGVDVLRWNNCLRPTAPWAGNSDQLPNFFPDYCKIANALPAMAPDDKVDNISSNAQMVDSMILRSEGIPKLQEFIRMAELATPNAVLEAKSSRQQYCSTNEPYEVIISEKWSTEIGAKNALEEYCRVGKDEFTNKHFIASDASNIGSNGKSMYASSVARIVKNHNPDDVLAQREGPTRAFSSALSLGALSARDVLDAARNRSPVTTPVFWWDGRAKIECSNDNRAGLLPSDNNIWGRSSEGCLSDVCEWREWFHLLAERSLALQEMGEPATSGGEKIKTNNNRGDHRENGHVNYWRWKGQHLVRYLTWPAGKDYDAQDEEKRTPAILLVHGFAASAEQWERLVYSIREQTIKSNDGKDVTPPIFAIDLLGFGYSEKPGLSYTQYLWESQIVDFAIEVMEATPLVMVGNSIGGGLSAGAAASLGKTVCRGLVLCNSAGVLLDPDTYDGYNANDSGAEIKSNINSHTEAALEGNPNEAPYSPVPILGNKSLDTFGLSIVKIIYPQIEDRLSIIYGNRMQNADAAVVFAIQQSALSPGSPNVIGSGQKLAPNRPLNEVLMGIGEDGEEGFPVLVVKGLDDRVNSPEAAKSRAERFSKLNPKTVNVETIEDAGHCPHDDAPDKVAHAMLKWFASSLQDTTVTLEVRTGKEKDATSVTK